MLSMCGYNKYKWQVTGTIKSNFFSKLNLAQKGLKDMFTRPGGQPFDSYCSSLFGILYGPCLLLMKVLVLPSFEKKGSL
jgi:hypothetical protein